MSWTIINRTTGEKVESHGSPKEAQRAMLILSAHELKNDRVPNYTIEPVLTQYYKLDELYLPSWAMPVLRQAEIELKALEHTRAAGGPLAAAFEEHLKRK